MKIVFATANPHKLQELKEIAGDTNIEFILPPKDFSPNENGKTFEENSYIKAKEAVRISNIISLADDSGLCVEALNGEPGIHSARYDSTPQKRIDRLLKNIENSDNRKAKFVCSMTLLSAKGHILFQTRGECPGEITKEQAGQNGFGYDPIFRPEGQEITMAEMSENEKNKISHRGRALRKVLEYIEANQNILNS